MMTRSEWLAQTCRHTEQAASDTELQAALAALPDWALEAGKLVREFRFKDYHQTLDFVNAIAVMIHAEDHHPELLVSYNRCRVSYDTHSVNSGQGGLSSNDFICAAKLDQIFDTFSG
jgi:4a-hydroxytetrahydrobiopterin dehydratase